MSDYGDSNNGCAVLALLALAFFVTWGFGCAKASAYERATGKQISVWDAIILDPQVRTDVKE